MYKVVWSPNVRDSFQVEIDETNRHDRFAVAVMVNGDIVGHVPREFAKVVYYFIRNNGIVTGEVCGRRKRSSVPMKGLEIPCI